MAATLAVRGILGTGVEHGCRTIAADSGGGYSLLGVPATFKDGDHVQLHGRLAEMSFCMQGQTIVVDHIEKMPAPAASGAAMAASAAGGVLAQRMVAVHVDVLFSQPPQYAIRADAVAPASPDPRPRLHLVGVHPSIPDVYDFKFLYDPPPTGTVTPGLMLPLRAQLLFNPGKRIRGLYVHASTNLIQWPQPIYP
jgi:hypothetical protein